METEKEKRWIFTKSELINTPSRKCGMDGDKELTYRQQAATMIQDMGQRLQVTQLCINTALVYMHRFYMYHSFTRFHRNVIGPACIFLAAKVEEQPRKLEHVLKERHRFLYRDGTPFETKSDAYLEQAQELVVNENILLQTLGFDITVDHPHTHVVKTCQLVRASKDFAQTSYFLATNSLHLTTMCLQYRPTVVACVCIHLASKWADYEINTSKEGKEWYWYIDKAITLELLEDLTRDFLTTLDKCPDRLKRSLMQKQRVLMEKEQQDAEQPAKKRPRLEPSATVTSGTCSTGEGKSKAAYPLSGPSNVLSRVMESVDSKPPPQLEGRGGGELSFVKKQVQTAHNAPHPMVHVKTEPGSTVVTTVTQDRPVASTKEQTPVPVVADVKQEPGLVTSRAPEKLSLRDYRQRQPMVQPARDSHQHPPVREANHTLSSRDTKPSPQQKELKHESVVMPDHLQLKEAKVVVQDLQHSHGHDRLMFTSAQNAADASRKRHHGDNGSDPDKRRHHHHHHSRGSHDGQRVLPESGESRRHSVKGEERECGRLSIGGHDSEKNSPHSPLKLHIKRESSGAHHIRHSSHSSQSSSPLKVKIKRDPETSSMHTATEDDARPPKEKKESLKVRLSLPSATSSSQGDKHSRHKMQDNTAPHQKITILMGAEGGGSSNARVLPSSHNSNGHNDRRRSKHSRGGSHEHHDSQYPGYPSGTSSDASMRRSASSSVMLAGAPPPPPEATASTVNIHYGGGSGGNFHHSGRPLLQSQYSGFSLGDGFLNTLPADIFEPDTPTGAGDLNGLGGFEAPQTPTADNMKQVRAHMQQMMAQHSHKSQSERIHQHHSLHNSSHLPPQHLLYLRDNRFSQPPPLPPPLPPDPNPPPPPPPPPSH